MYDRELVKTLFEVPPLLPRPLAPALSFSGAGKTARANAPLVRPQGVPERYANRTNDFTKMAWSKNRRGDNAEMVTLELVD